MARVARVATCNLNTWALDFEGNLKRILTSIERAKKAGAKYRLGPELEIPGYGCEDHFLELDTVEHSWQCLAEILKSDATYGILCDVGLPVIHDGVRYNCRAYLLDGRVLLLRPKMALANDGNYREGRYFAAWKKGRALEQHVLPRIVVEASSDPTATKVPFGDAIVQLQDTCIATESCEEVFTPASMHIQLALNGVEIFANGSGSHHQLRKLETRMNLMVNATTRCGGVYLYANHKGCDGSRLYFDGCACILSNGKPIVQGSQFALADVEVQVANVDLDAVQSYRGSIPSFMEQASESERIPKIDVTHFSITADAAPTPPMKSLRYHTPEEEIGYGPACWLWDFLRRSGASGYLLPLSGGADSSSSAAITGMMCHLVMRSIEAGDKQVLEDARRIGGYSEGESPAGADEFASRIFHTMYMGSENSSKETRSRAKNLAAEIGAHHIEVPIDTLTAALISLFAMVTKFTPRFRVDGGTTSENLALQNIQARMRMVLAYLFAQLLLLVRKRAGFLLVMGSANVDEGLCGYLTKYDCSSADVNPIGGVSKSDLRKFLKWAGKHYPYRELLKYVGACPWVVVFSGLNRICAAIGWRRRPQQQSWSL